MSSSLIKRIGMGFLFAPFFIMVVWFGKIPFLIMVMFIALIAQLEFYDIAKNLHPKGAPYQWIGLLTGMLSCWFIYDGFTFALLPVISSASNLSCVFVYFLKAETRHSISFLSYFGEKKSRSTENLWFK